MTYRDADTQAAQAAVLALRSRQCRWPIGHVDEPDFRFCTADAITGSRYCACHDWDSRAVKRGRRPVPAVGAGCGADVTLRLQGTDLFSVCGAP